MSKENNANFLPQILENKLESDVSGSKISLKDIEIATGKSASELEEVVTEKICSLPVAQAKNIWNALDEESRAALTYHDKGSFNLYLVEKLNIRGGELHAAFISNLARYIFQLDNAPLFSGEYLNAFHTIQSELLSICKQLMASRPQGAERLLEFLNSFDIEFLASVVRHEIARHYIDEEGEEFDIAVWVDDNGNQHRELTEIESQDRLNDDPEDFGEGEIAKNELEEFKRIFENGFTVPPFLELTYWLQCNVPAFYLNIRNLIIFISSQRSTTLWDRPNPLKAKNIDVGERINESLKESSEEKYRFSNSGKSEEGLVVADTEKEERRLARLYAIHHPSKKDFRKPPEQYLDVQGNFIGSILVQTGKGTRDIQTFEQLKKNVWDAIGLTGLRQWIDKQPNASRLIHSSGKSFLLDQMNVLGAGAFGSGGILDKSLEVSKSLVFKLYGWFCLVKIFEEITVRNKKFSDLATVKKNILVWEETITVNTLVFQAVLNTEKMFFSLDEVIIFCEATNHDEWVSTMKRSFVDLAKKHDAPSAIPLFHERIEYLADRPKNIFSISDEILLATKKEKQIVKRVKEIVSICFQSCLIQIEEGKPVQKVIDKIRLNFNSDLEIIPGASKYKNHAESYLEVEIGKLGIESVALLNPITDENIMPNDSDESRDSKSDKISDAKKFENIWSRIKKSEEGSQ